MKKLQTQKGFTLVELAIVMTIIGLLIGGILKGQELLNNARVTATIAQARAFEAATTTFRDKYDALPGDMGANASTRIPGCVVACNYTGTTNGTGGDGLVGSSAWPAAAGSASTTTVAAQVTAALSINTTAQIAVGAETQLFWTHLLLSDLITGVNSLSLTTSTAPALNVTHPAAKIAGGWSIGSANGVPFPGAVAGAGTGSAGLVPVISTAPGTTLGTTSGSQPLTATRAAQIDRKMDDGRPHTGFVTTYGTAATCFGPSATAANAAYQENITANACGLVIRIQG